MGLHRSKENLEVAKKENASILYEDDYLETYGGYDPNSPESNIIFSMFQNLYLNQSLTMASLVQNQFRDRAGRHDRGVKQAGFLVLYNITMPGVLVEAGFLSNPQEELYLMSETGKAHIASAIFRAFRDYKEYHDNIAKQQLATLTNGNNHTESDQQTPASIQPDNSNQPSQQNKSGSENPNQMISFRVQFATTSVERPIDAEEFKGLQGVSFYVHDGLYKYTVGDEQSLEAAARIQQNLHKIGFTDAFVVAFKNDERISPAEAMRLINQDTQTP
jgi:N-acetylmuramoyl-L-alanine amidase